VRVVFVGSPPVATPILERLVDGPFRPVLVVTRPDRPRGRRREAEPSELALAARGAGLELYQPEKVCGPEALERLRAAEPDVVLVAAYGEYLTDAFRALPRRECLNVHPSLLPRHRGASPIQAAILAGDRVTGVSIQRVARELDAGDVLVARELAIGEDETAGELGERLARLGAEAAVEALERLASGEGEFRPQDPAGVTECRKLAKQDGWVDWSADAASIARLVRAMNPWPLARTTLPGGKELLLLAARARDAADAEEREAEPGTLVAAADRLAVATGDGVLELARVKPAGKRELAADEFLRGARLARGDRLGRAADRVR